MINRLYIFPIALFVVIFDQLTKFVVSKQILIGENIILIPGFLSLVKAYNTGAAFSILEGKTMLLAFFSLIVAIVISVYFIKNVLLLPIMLAFAWGLILGGTIGNLIDRLMLGYVIDFIKLDFINFPIFNIADLSINIGALLLILYALIKTFQLKKEEKF